MFIGMLINKYYVARCYAWAYVGFYYMYGYNMLLTTNKIRIYTRIYKK